MANRKNSHDFYQVSLKAIMKNNKGEVLILKSTDTGTYEGFWDLPGGRIDVDEFTTDLSEVLRREVQEEVGEAVKFNVNPNPVALGRHNILKKHAGEYGRDVHVLYPFFEADYIEGEIEISDEHNDIKWVDLKKIDLKEYFTSGILEGMEMYLRK